MSNIDHLDAEAASLLEASFERRCEAVNRRFYVSHDLADKVIKAVQWRMDLPPAPRVPSVAFGGGSGLGKTHILYELMRLNGVDRETGLTASGDRPIFVMECTGIQSAKLFRERFWKLVGGTPGKSDDIYDACLLIRRSKTKLVVLDEAHTLRKVKPAGDRILVSDYVKLICNVCERPIMLIGDVNVADILEADKHLASRFMHWKIEPWTSVDDLRRFIDPILARFPFPEPSPITDDATLGMVIEASGGITEKIVISLRAAAIRCLDAQYSAESGERRQPATRITRADWLKTLSEPF